MAFRVIGVMLATLVIAGQQRDDEFRLTADANLVLLDVSVKDAAGRYVSNLTKDNFHVYEGSKQQAISQFTSGDAPVTVGLVIDNSGSMRPKRADVVNAAMTFIMASNPKDEVFVTHFNDVVRQGLPDNIPFSDDPQLLRASLLRNGAEGKTALYDAIVISLHHLNAGTQGKKSLLLISDGGDNASIHHFSDVIDDVRESLATIYTIGVFDEDDMDRNPGLLRRLASVSGGQAFFPKDLSELNGICRQIAKDVRNRYTIGYVPQNIRGKSGIRTLRVTASSGEKNFIVRARTSYRLPDGVEETRKRAPRQK